MNIQEYSCQTVQGDLINFHNRYCLQKIPLYYINRI
jgi:hypothetical protein